MRGLLIYRFGNLKESVWGCLIIKFIMLRM